MQRILGVAALLVVLTAVGGGCDSRKDEIPTQTETSSEGPPPPSASGPIRD